jgi:hypothetical protein
LAAVRDGHAKYGARKLAECVRIAELPGTPLGGSALMAGLVAAVDFASYWAQPDAEDRGFAGEWARAALRPVAEAVAAAAAGLTEMGWWAKPADRGRQRCTQFLARDPLPQPRLTGTAQSAAAWLADTRDDEQSARGRPEDPAAPHGGPWRSAPVPSRLPVTTRQLPGLGAVALTLTEDRAAGPSARCWPVTTAGGARVYEITGPGQWAELVSRYPLEVSNSRRRTWGRATGQDGRWLIPDYAAVAADWDAVHLPTVGYLTTAGIVIPAGASAHTMLAGWDPDATWWLTDVLSFSSPGPPEAWRTDDRAPSGWTHAQ